MEMTKSTKTIYFVIDCSGSMYGARADAVNVAMEKVAREAIPKIKADKGSQIDCRFKFLGFSDGFNGKVVELMSPATLDTFKAWKKIPQTSFRNGTPTGAALQAVIDDLEGAQNGDRDMNAPAAAIILVSDGMPNGPVTSLKNSPTSWATMSTVETPISWVTIVTLPSSAS